MPELQENQKDSSYEKENRKTRITGIFYIQIVDAAAFIKRQSQHVDVLAKIAAIQRQSASI